MIAVALELQHAVDEMLEHARPGDRTVLRHVPDEDRRHPFLLGDAQQASRRFPHLPDRAGGGAEVGRVQRLDGVDHADIRASRVERGAHDVEVGLREDLHVLGSTQALGPKLHLRDRLLTGDEQGPPARPR